MSEADLLRRGFGFIELFGFLETPQTDEDPLGCIPKYPFPSDTILPSYTAFVSRSLIDGTLGDFYDNSRPPIDYVINPGLDSHLTDPDVSTIVSEVVKFHDEVNRKIKGQFFLDEPVRAESEDTTNHFRRPDSDLWDRLLQDASASGLRELGITDSQSVHSFDFSHLELETQQLMKKRLRNTEPTRQFAIMEDSSKQLPEFSKLLKEPAYTWPFELDTFQKQAILCLENNQSVFVAAHTSAGKTVVAEYAAAMCRRRGSRVIYTSPIKALSNQKFHDFRRNLGDDVGLLTGDIKVATDSSLLIMTTEILHNMLCNSADAIRDLEIVIMDEVHYLNDAERGHVWEQIMIMLPKHVVLVMLSATVPNTLEFADWLGRIRGSEIHVVATDKRPVPLEHYLFTGLDGQATSKQLHLVVDRHGQFHVPGYKQAIIAFNEPKTKKPKGEKDTSRAEELAALAQQARGGRPAPEGVGGRGGASGRGGGKGGGKHPIGGKLNTPGRWNYMPSNNRVSVHEKRVKNMWLGVVRLLQERELMPAIAFGFSRHSLEVLAEHLSSVDLLSKSEKNEVQQFLRFSIKNRLKGPDSRLPSVLFISGLVKRGIAVHHAGMLPLLKETVEMLFQRGLIRLLFATETFAMGVNMPARCVLFSTLEKFDGRRRRPLNPGEYTQMAGRAGRRGLDASGTVIILVEGVGQSVASIKTGIPSQETLTGMILGKPTQLTSQFKITYSMILHLHRTNWLSPQDIMRRSFMEAPALRHEIKRRQYLTQLRNLLLDTTFLIPSAGSSTSAVGTTSAQAWTEKTGILPTSPVSTGEPILQVKCPFGQTQCVQTMATYYQACCKFRQLSASISVVLAIQSLPDLQRVFCPGRLLFVRLPARKTRGRSTQDAQDWLVPAMVVDVNKVSVRGETEVQWSLITWELPAIPDEKCSQSFYMIPSDPKLSNAAVSRDEKLHLTVEDDHFDEETEEEVLQDGEDQWMAPTPFPPQLMPVFNPASIEDGLARLTLLNNQTSRCLIRVCDECVQFKNYRVTTNSSVTLSELLTRAMARHRQERAASEAGLRLVVGSNTAAADDLLPQLVDESNRGLCTLVRQVVALSSRNAGNDEDRTVVHGLPADFPTSVQLGRVLRAKTNATESNDLFSELWLLGEELTTPLLGASVTQRLAPMTCPDVRAHLAQFHRTCRRRWAVKRLETSLSNDKLSLNSEYLGRLRVLEELGFIDTANEKGCLSLKGLVACELQQMEVLLTQLLLDGSFTQLPAVDIAALMSCFVFELRASDLAREEQRTAQTNPTAEEPQAHVMALLAEKIDSPVNVDDGETDGEDKSLIKLSSKQKMTVPEHLHGHVLKIYQFASDLEQLQRKHGLADSSADTRLNCSLVRATHAWASGNPFATIVGLAEMQEGNLIRGLLRLDELLRHVCNACHRLGDRVLGLRMNEARNAIHRDLVCSPSLYISDEFVYRPAETEEQAPDAGEDE